MRKPEEAWEIIQSTTIDRYARPSSKPARASVLLVEDNAGLRDSLSDYLEEAGYDVDQCVDLHEAMVLLELGYCPELIIVDDAIPHDSGWLGRLRGTRDVRAAGVPLVVLSSSGLSLRDLGSEVDACLSKPVEPERLRETLAELLAAAREEHMSARALESQRLSSLGGIPSGLANELNNPVSFLVGNLELARKHCQELGRRLEGRELELLQEIDRLVHHGLRGAGRVADVVQSASALRLSETGRSGAIDVDYETRRGTEVQKPARFSSRLEEAPKPVSEPVATSEDRARILVIDDEQLMCELLATMLEEEHHVDAIASAREALSRISAGEKFDLILCDLMMPELTGMDLYAELSRVDPKQAARMVFMTGGTFTDRAQQFLAEHGRVQLQKPFRHDELLRLVNEQLSVLKRTDESSLH